MKTSSNWVKNGALLATAIAAVFFMSGYGVASVEKLWTEFINGAVKVKFLEIPPTSTEGISAVRWS